MIWVSKKKILKVKKLPLYRKKTLITSTSECNTKAVKS